MKSEEHVEEPRAVPTAPAPALPKGASGAARPETNEGGRSGVLFDEGELQKLRNRWREIQGGFVDEPRRAVQEADALVADAINRLAQMFAEERAGLERQWDRGDQVTTEDLRLALRRYHGFFDRLLAA